MNKKDLEVLLKKAGKDISFLSKNLGAAVSSDDPVVAAVALALKDLIYQAHTESNHVISDLTNEYAKNEVKPDDIDEFNKQFLRKAFVKTNQFDENGDPIYRTMWAFHQELFYDKYQKDYTKFRADLESSLKAIELNFRKQNEIFLAQPTNINAALQYTDEWIENYIAKRRAKALGLWYSQKTEVVDNIYGY